jgi:hypothetical protein
MLVSHKKKFIYTKTAKTAGTSIESYFEQYCMPKDQWIFQHARDEHISTEGIIGFRGGKDKLNGQTYYNHMPAVDIKQKVGNQVWDSYYKFCVVRDPFDKLVSAFYFSERDSDGSVKNFRKWLLNTKFVDRYAYLIDGEICMDYFIRYESLYDGVKHICTELNIPFDFSKVPQLKTKFRNREIPLYDFYDADSIELVKKLYRFELDYFGYCAPKKP